MKKIDVRGFKKMALSGSERRRRTVSIKEKQEHREGGSRGRSHP